MEGKRCVIVPRVSERGEREDDKFHSPQIQVNKATDWILSQTGREPVAVLDETDVSGKLPLNRRRGLRVAVEMVEAHEADYIVVAYFDRLVRSLKVQLEVTERVEKAGGEIFALDHGRLTNGTAAMRLSAHMLGSVFQFYSEIIGEKVKPAQEEAISKGVCPFPNVPPGVRLNSDGRCEPDPDTIAIVTEAFTLFADGASYPAVRAHLADHDIHRSLRGVQKMLRSHLYVGEIHFGTRTPNLSAHDPIIDPDLFARVQERKPTSRGRRADSDHLLARLGVLRCGTCGGALTINTGKGSGAGGTYRCQGGTARGCDNRVSVSAPRVEAIAIEEVTRYVTNENIHGAASREARIRAADAKVTRCDTALQKALRLLRDFMNEEGTLETLTRLRAERDSARADRDKLGVGGRKVHAHPADIVKLPAAKQAIAWRRLLTDTGCCITVAPADGQRVWNRARLTVIFSL